MRYAFVIPVYNHGDTISAVIKKALQFDFPIFVIDDGSTDNSHEKASAFSQITVLRHDTNQGKGAALQTGFQTASQVADWAITLDADGQHDPQHAHQLIKKPHAHQRAIVLGHRKGMHDSHVPWTSRFGRGFSNFWLRLCKGPAVRDSQSGFRMYPLPEVLALNTKTKRFQYEVEVLTMAKWKGLPVIEAPIGVHYQSKTQRISHFRPFVDFWRNSFMFTRLIFWAILLPKSYRAKYSSTKNLRFP
jgi:glycosyltransferase involved in cell wall biosynthesis